MISRLAPSPLTREILREEMVRFLQDSLKPELSRLSDGLSELVQSEITSCLGKTFEAWVARGLVCPPHREEHGHEDHAKHTRRLSHASDFSRPSQLLPARLAKRSSVRSARSFASQSGSLSRRTAHSLAGRPSTCSSLGRKFLRNPGGTAHRERIAAERKETRQSLRASGSIAEEEQDIFQDSVTMVMEEQDDYGWMSRHRKMYEEPLLFATSTTERLSTIAALAAATEDRGGFREEPAFPDWKAAITWRRSHEESYRQLHLAQDKLRSAATPDDEIELLQRGDTRCSDDGVAWSMSIDDVQKADSVGFAPEVFSAETEATTNSEAKAGNHSVVFARSESNLDTARSTSNHNSRASMRSGVRNTNRRLSDDISHQIYPSGDNLERQSRMSRNTLSGGMLLRMATIVVSPKFAYVVSVLIMLNALMIGIKTDYCARHWTQIVPASFTALERAICTCFVIEILMRLYVFRTDFFIMSGCASNIFDLIVVTVQVMDEVGFLERVHEHFTHSKEDHGWFDWKSMPLVRILRLVRLVRVASLLHLLTELRMLLISISDSMKSVVWVLFLLLLIMYVIGVYFTQVVTFYKVSHESDRRLQADVQMDLESNYGNLLRTMLSLFETIASGVSWREVVDPLWQHCSPWMLVFFLSYVFFTMFVVLNVVTGVFVSSATEKANEDRKKILMFQLRELFRDADIDKSGCMSWTKFLGQLQDPKMQTYLKAIDLHEEEALDLFHLLDTDDSDEIDEHEFVNGCLRLHGGAKAIDLATFMFDYKSWTHMWSEHAYRVEAKLDDLCGHLLPSSDEDLSDEPGTE